MNAATPEFAAAHGLKTTPAPPAYLEEPRGIAQGHGLLARPETTAEVARIIRACADARVGVIPYGGGTGLVGGQISGDGPAPVILSLERMTSVRSVDANAGTLTADAGATLAQVQDAADAAARLFPLSLASEGTARIGGNLATNAGGVQVLRYGNARDLCLGVEAVLPDGTIHHGLTGLRKDNTGYDLRHLLIGSEGTLGVITAATLRLFPRPAEQATAMAPVTSPAAAISLLARLQDETGGMLTAFELISGQGLHFLAETLPQVRQVFDTIPEWMVLAEAGAGRESGIEAAVTSGLMAGVEAGEALDVVLAQSGQQRDDFWTLRESIPAANRAIGAISSHDISVPIGAIPDFLVSGAEVIRQIGPLRTNCFGHLGDGNLHYNIFAPTGEAVSEWRHLRAEVSGAVYDLVAEFGGSISAEHGIGRFKRDALIRHADPAKLAAMSAIKAALDPQGIMNPGAVV
ncbi:MAG: FAD-binding oxidoreductase [Pseudomonadota bacterium]